MLDQPETLGPYRLLDPLGAGGMGVVYRAVHEGTGHPVAVKTVRVVERTMLAGIRREIHALTRLDHPGIVKIIEDGFDHGLPWYAMKLVDGEPLFAASAPDRQWWTGNLAPMTRTNPLADRWLTETHTGAPVTADDATGGSVTSHPTAGRDGPPRGLVATLTLVRRLCSALAYLHGEGLVHRDLKPENILVRRDDMPVIVDFGITTRFGGALGREALEVETATVGTAAYMAPEQVLGELVDARADLYAVGCVLYELLTGKPPFTGGSVHAMQHKHLSAPPLAPSAISRGVPAELDDLVLRLLEKQPERRLGHADDVAAALVRLGAEDAMPEPVPRPRAYLYRPRLCGRRAELERLEGLVAGAKRSAGGIAFVGGESGVGKTRLAIELGRRAGFDGALVLSGECLAASGETAGAYGESESALMPFRRPLREIADLCRDEGLDASERIIGRRGPVLALFEPTISTLPGQSAYPTPAEMPGSAALDRLFDALASSLVELAASRPLVLILDDLQWADELTLGFLAWVAERRAFEPHAILAIATYRSEEVEGEAFERRHLRSLLDRDDVARLELSRMDEATVEAMVGEMLALDPPPGSLSRFLSDQSEGNPFFVAEYLRAAVAEGVLHRARGSWRVEGEDGGRIMDAGRRSEPAPWEHLGLPRSLRDLVARRLEGLDADARKLVDAGAILGREMDVALLRRVARIGGGPMLTSLHDLVRRQVLEDQGGGVVRFVHDKLREVAFDRLPEARRRRLHGSAARELEKRSAEESAEWHAALGAHWAGAREPVRARDHYREAARLATTQYAYAQAETHYRRYLELADRPGLASVEARNELAVKVLTLWGKNAEALDVLLEALDEARQLEDRPAEADTLSHIAEAYRHLGRMDECRAACQEALAIHRATGDVGGEARTLGLWGIVLHLHDSQLAEAQTAYETAIDLARRVGDGLTEGRALSNLGGLMIKRGEFAMARHLIDRAIETLRSVGAHTTAAAAMSSLPLISGALGHLDEAIDLHREALTACRESGYRRFEGINLSNLASLLLRRGSLDEARSLLEQALAIHREIGHRRFEGMTIAHLGDYHFTCGELERAEALFAEALGIHREVGNREFEGETLSAIAECRSERGDLEGARALNAQALALHREMGNMHDCGITLVRMATVERRQGRLAEAGALLDQAEELLEERGDKLFVAIGLCERGHLNLARGLPADELLRRARALAEEVSAGPSSNLGRALAQLSRAVEAG